MQYVDLEDFIFIIPFIYFSLSGIAYLYTRKRFR
jgi:hypothetical protein